MTIRILSFYETYKEKVNADGKTTMVARDRVIFAPAHAVLTTQTDEFVSKLMPEGPLDVDNERSKNRHYIWGIIGPAYEAWKKGHELPETGTPLGAWPGITQAQADVLKQLAIRTVEDLAGITDSVLPKIQLPNVRELREQAKIYLANSDRAAAARVVTDIQDRLAAEQERSAAMQAQLDEALRMLNELTEPKQGEEAPRRRGRPPIDRSTTEEAA